MASTTAAAVQAVLGGNWDQTTDLTPFIDAAAEVVADAVTCAAVRSTTISSTKQELMERWLAAHYYTQMDPLYTSKSTGDASGSFKDYGYDKVAIALDPTGCLVRALNGQKVATSFWLGKTEPNQQTWDERN